MNVRRLRHTGRLAVMFAAALGASSYTPNADACGCLTPVLPRPSEVDFAVNQQSEQIIFEVDDGYVEAHVLIRYAGAPESFGWLIPIPSVPDITLSHSGAFGLIDQNTRPQVNVSSQGVCPSPNYVCREHPPPNCPPPPGTGTGSGVAGSSAIGFPAAMGSAPGAAGAGTATGSTSAPPPPPPVTVYSRQQIGGYETVVLGSGDATAIVDWLNDNEFVTNDTITPYMQPYLDADMLFVAARLVPGAGVDEIRPLRLRYEGDEPSIPLKLTAVAAEPHLTVTAYIYSNREYRPVERPVVELDSRHIARDPSGRINYPMLLNRTIDDGGGDAFVVEYSGAPPRYVDQSQGCCDGTATPRFVQGPFPGTGVPIGTTGVAAAGATSVPASGGNAAGGEASSIDFDAGTGEGGSAGANMSVDPSLNPAADVCGIGGDGQCQCPFAAFDQADCADSEELTGSIQLLVDLAQKYSHMTRLTTRLSPEEMTFDPSFEPADASTRTGAVNYAGKLFVATGCEDRIIDEAEFARQTELAGCATLYCGLGGECASVEGGVGCVCDAGFVARTFTDLDGRESVTCVPATHTVDLGAGGIEIPDVCAGLALPETATCVDVGGFPAVQCGDGTAAVLQSGKVPSCAAVRELSGETGAINTSLFLEDADICAPPPPTCSSWGWLEEAPSIPIPGVECPESIPDPSWFDVPPAPTCEDRGAVAQMGSVSVPATSRVATSAARPDVVRTPDASSPNPSFNRAGGCHVGVHRAGAHAPLLLAFATLLLGATRRRRG